MVVQNNWNNSELSQTNIVPGTTTSTSWTFPAPTKIITVRPAIISNMQTKQPVTRQIAINTLAAMHRRFSLPGPVQPHSRPIAEFRASANKSLDMLRQTVQSAVTREIDQVIKKYLEKFFVPAVNNIRLNLGDESVSEDQVRAVCRAMLDATRLLYTNPPKPSSSPFESSAAEDAMNSADLKLVGTSTATSCLQNPQTKRKDFDDLDPNSKHKKTKRDISQMKSFSVVTVIRDPEKWNPDRLHKDTLFIMGSHAHKVLGLGNARGRLYTRHAGLLRYPADSSDKEWIASHNLVNAVGGKTYIMVLDDIEELATSEAYKHTSLPLLGELTGFKIPPFMLRKIKTYVLKRAFSGELSDPNSPQPSTSNSDDDKIKLDDIKTEIDDTFDFNTNFMNSERSTELQEVNDMIKDDFADIKVEDMDDMKVDGIKVEDLGVDDIKVENIDDINVDEIKVDDIKLEVDDFDLKSDEDNNLVDGLLEADIEFLSRNLGNIESDADARKTIETLTGANADSITLVGDEFDLGTTLNTNNYTDKEMKCITVASTTSGMVHSVPVSHIAPPCISAGTVHYYTSSTLPSGHKTTIHHLPKPTLTIHNNTTSQPQIITGIPINSKAGTFSTVMSQGTASTIIGFGTRTSNATIISTPQYVNVTSKSFPTGNILHNAIMSRNILNRANLSTATSGVTFNLTAVRPIIHTSTSKINNDSSDFDNMSTTKDMIDNACNSSVMLKKVLTLGSAGATKSFIMHNTQKVLSTGFANGATPPPNVTIVSSGTGGIIATGNINQSTSNALNQSTATLSATHATLSALLSSSAEKLLPNKN